MSHKRKRDSCEETAAKRPRAIKWAKVPSVSTLHDLIMMGESDNTYENIDNVKLRAITPALRRLNTMIGIDHIKSIVLKQIIYFMQHTPSDPHDDFMHTKIIGPAGCGKTSLAEILADIYCHLGLLSTGKVISVHRRNLIGQHCGETANLTEDAVRSAFGGVLLIDEAYNIGGAHDHVDTFAKECVDTLCTMLSEHARDFICIIVGYKESLEECFFKINPGLERRFPWEFDMANTLQTHDILSGIFQKQANESGYKIHARALEIFKNKYSILKYGGGDTKILLNRAKLNCIRRQFGKITKYLICVEDMEYAFEELHTLRANNSVSNRILSMYS
jgi:hypothetical protein